MKKIIISILLVFSVILAKAQKMEEAFVKMPDNIIIQLEEAWRKDLVDLFKSGKSATLENTMQGQSTLQKLTDDYLLLQSTENSIVEMKLLPLINNTNIICLIETVFSPVADSRISFYSTEWQLINANELFIPVTEGWFLKDDVDRLSPAFEDAVAKLDIYLVKYSLCSESMNLIAEYMTPQYLNKEYREKVLPFLKTGVKTYEWKSGRYE